MEGVAYVIGHNFFCLKLVCPYIKRLCLIKDHPGFFLLNHDIHSGKNTFDQRSQVKTLHNCRIFSRFQLVQCEKVLNQLVHLGRLVNNNITIEIHALRIIIDILFQTLCISLYKSNRGFQLMGNIVQEFLSHFIDFYFVFNVFLQLIIG